MWQAILRAALVANPVRHRSVPGNSGSSIEGHGESSGVGAKIRGCGSAPPSVGPVSDPFPAFRLQFRNTGATPLRGFVGRRDARFPGPEEANRRWPLDLSIGARNPGLSQTAR